MAVTRRAVLRSVVATSVGTLTGTGAYGFLYGRHELEVTRATIPVDGWPAALAGLRIGLLTDLHRSRFVSHEDVAHAVETLMTEHPDLIVLGGDYVTDRDHRYVGPSAEALAPLAAPHGVFAILGNHDDDHEMPAALGKNGVEVLKDARTRLTIHHEAIDLIGIRYWTKRPADIALLAQSSASASLLLAHDPRRLNEAAVLGVPLVLSGHTHGGQVVLPLVGPLAARKFPVIAGIGRRDRTTMFVSRGVGTVYVPVRVNCPPEVAVLTIQPA
ncbi:MAG TPA: metallophosphoesterase [Vicinamibacterales bacterium]|jgi:predicted MPP superfamily phosphohydrolase|nr:metallophosphoesterase [Vicinamibacterales bacterium]